MIKLAILASGSGTNAENIVKYFSDSSQVKVRLIGANKSSAYVLERARKLGVSSFVFNKTDMESGEVLDRLSAEHIDYVILAGFLLKVSDNLLQKFPTQIINIHPALLPKFGGKGMYGDHVHAAVIAKQEKESGITIHLVNENYDEGKILFQAKCPVNHADTVESLASRIHKLEYEHFPKIIEDYILNRQVSDS
ncbi:MAG: phosphoribosylglycinamide formyltransferase [Cyclobacteriaceae bacterium]